MIGISGGVVALMLMFSGVVSATGNQAPTPMTAPAKALVLATKQVVGPERRPVLFAFHVVPKNSNDTGWIFWSGDEDQAYISDSSNTVIASLDGFLAHDPSLAEILNKPVRTAWERDNVAAPWREVPDYFGEQ
jgi:hypothetical protein